MSTPTKQYRFIAVAPCSFSMLGKAFSYKAGQPFTVPEQIGSRFIQQHFQYKDYFRLISIDGKAPESPKKPEIQSTSELVVEENIEPAIVAQQIETNINPLKEVEYTREPFIEEQVSVEEVKSVYNEEKHQTDVVDSVSFMDDSKVDISYDVIDMPKPKTRRQVKPKD